MKNAARNSRTEQVENEVRELVRGALPDKTAAMVVQLRIDWFHRREREFYLRKHPEDIANGHDHRKKVSLGSVPMELEVPRTRSGKFKPSRLPAPYRLHRGDLPTPDGYASLVTFVIRRPCIDSPSGGRRSGARNRCRGGGPD